MRGPRCVRTGSSPASAAASVTSVLARSATSSGSLSAAISARACSAPSDCHHMRAIHSGCECLTAACCWRAVAERRQQRVGPLARGAAQDRVDEAVAGAGGRAVYLCELDGVGDHRVVGRAGHVQQLVEPEPQRGQQRRVERGERAASQLLDQMVERALALDGAVGQAHRQRAVARVQVGGLGGERAIGVGALLEHAPQHRVGAAAGGGDGGDG